ncbi:xylulokinase [Xanthovirga aplysinae]|uniref:xylulokinase n=1 Tax=Xanthovirga aplysinae TaxID=2529853 RepID=UPI0012BCE415|nr:FGGY family carbohydrate kinase [Xanthovirga aplysinae]MTI33391.1 carbohydrate kinase [Xanthovirga aplysinae]
MLCLGLDIGSSSVKITVYDAEKGSVVASTYYPEGELRIDAPSLGWAEQNPEMWWDCIVKGCQQLFVAANFDPLEIQSIGITYQMHGLVLVDKEKKVLRPSIIWCDSRAVPIGDKALKDLGHQYCLSRLLNSPGNFTASKLKWVKENEPEIYQKIHKIMWPGDYVAMKLTGEITTTCTALSEGIFWDYGKNELSRRLMEYYEFEESLIPALVSEIGMQGCLSAQMANELGLKAGTPITYRAGDQPNNAFSLNALKPGEVAATAGTSGVIYAVTDKKISDPHSRVNTFLHVNNSPDYPINGVLLCVNGTGSLYRWVRQTFNPNISYAEMNDQAGKSPLGAEGLHFYPFGNGAERMLHNRQLSATMKGLNFNKHHQGHIFRAAQEGIVFALNYGMEILKNLGIDISRIRAGNANMFLSPLFKEAFTNISGVSLYMYNTDGSVGAALGSAIGVGYFNSFEEAFKGLTCTEVIEPDMSKVEQYKEAYKNWKLGLEQILAMEKYQAGINGTIARVDRELV